MVETVKTPGQPDAPISVTLNTARVVNYAMQQNDMPVVNGLRIMNHSASDIEQVSVVITTEPSFSHGWQVQLDRIPAGTAYDFGTIDLQLSHGFLAQQTEAISGTLCVTVGHGDDVLIQERAPIEILAYDQWPGSRVVPELLAAFVMPNQPVVEGLLRQAAQLLGQQTGTTALSGYQSRDRSRVLNQVAAIFAAVQQRQLNYIGVPASFERTGQKIRTPDRVNESKQGNCLDLTCLFAACLEQAGLHPLLIVIEGHAFPGVWLDEETFADSVIDDPIVLRKRIDLGEILVFESTLVTEMQPVAFGTAVEAGTRCLNDPTQFLYAIDVRRARHSRIKPLPSRAAWTTHDIATEADPVQLKVPTDIIETTLADPGVESDLPTESPADRLDRWKRKLLDLTMRNRLLNFKQTKSVVPVLCSDLSVLENMLATGTILELHPRPRDWQVSERDVEVHRRRTGEDAEKGLLADELKQRRLRCDLEQAELTKRLTETYRSARSSLEENGANTLYLALGMLIWYESKSSNQPRQAPILLLPVELQRRSTQSGYTVRLRDEEPMANVTLLEFLRHDFDLHISGLDPLPDDEAGIDVAAILTKVRRAIKHLDRWDVVDTAYIGLFSFNKFLMWRDLELRTEELKTNKLVASLINPAEVVAFAGSFPEADQLDDTYSPSETFTPLSADSSQLTAVYAAGEGKSFVLHGAPGTGKSQTIANIIAHTLAQGKTVLFVAEKMAALSVVQRRLADVGLGPFCLELHSNKSKKTDVLAQLNESLQLAALKSPVEWQLEAERLEASRRELNQYVRALHKPRQANESFFTGIAKLIQLKDAPKVVPFDGEFVSSLSAVQLEKLRDKLRSLTAAAKATGYPVGHVWRWVRTSEWSPQLVDQIGEAINRFRVALEMGLTAVQAVADLLGLPAAGRSWRELATVAELARLILDRSSVAPSLVSVSDWAEAEEAVTRWVSQGRQRDGLRVRVFARYTNRILGLDLQQLKATHQMAAQKWFLPRWLATQRIIKALRSVAQPGVKLSAEHLEQDLTLAIQLKGYEDQLAVAGDEARRLLGRLWCDGEADWTAVLDACGWAQSVRRLAVQLAGEDLLKAKQYRECWAALLSEGADQLGANGAYAKRLSDYVRAFDEIVCLKSDLVTLLDLDEKQCWGDESEPQFIERVRVDLLKWSEHLGQLRLWSAWMKERHEAVSLGLGPVIDAYEAGQLTFEQLSPAFERAYYEAWVSRVIGEEDELRRFSRQSMEERIERFRQQDEEFSRLTRQAIRARLSARVPRSTGDVSNKSEMGVLRRELQKRTRHMALRKLFERTKNLLPKLKPCLLMSPISVAQYLDPDFPRFDLVIFDEASQVSTWDAVGAIARGVETLIVGDPKQLPPTSFFTRASEVDEDEDDIEDLESILDDALALNLPELHLQWHYRSRHESLIAFSNHQYYENRLLSFPSPQATSAVSFRYVKGEYDRAKSRTNRVEAQAVVQEVVRRLRDPLEAQKTVGIVTFSIAQQRLIEDLLDAERSRFPEIEPYFAHETEPVFVKNLESVQGDERDVILFSICYGPDQAGRINVNFGPLNRAGGYRRLNVAVTRARQEVVVFSSLQPEEIDLSRTRAEGVHHLRLFLEYAKRGVKVLQEQISYEHLGEFDSPFEEEVYKALTARGYKVHSQVGVSGYRIDLAVVDPERPGHYLIGIECDGATYHRAKTARDRDKLREQVLVGLGWQICRIWSTDWWQDPANELERLVATIERAKKVRAEMLPPRDDVATAGVEPVVEPPSEEAQAVAQLELPIYQVSSAEVPPEATWHDFYGSGATPYLKALIQQVVEEEGPISFSLLCQRVAPQWGLNRVTARVTARVDQVVKRMPIRRVRHPEGIFLWSSGLDPREFRIFRVPGDEPASRREVTDLPPEEIANAVVYVLEAQVSLPLDDLVREVARLFGYQRIGQKVDRCLRAGIALLASRQQVFEHDGMVVLSRN